MATDDLFKYQLEILNLQAGSRKLESAYSTILWPDLQQKIAQILNIFPTSLHAQYRLSTEGKNALPFDLTSQSDLNVLHNMLRPLVIPPRKQNGQRSGRKMKEVKVQVFNKGDTAQTTVAEHSEKCWQYKIFLLSWCLHR